MFEINETIPFTQATETTPGVVTAVTQAAAASVNLDPGIYKIAAVGEPLMWKKGATDVTNTTGSYLAAGDQELVKIVGVPGTDQEKLSFINSLDSAADGNINICLVHMYNITTVAPESATVLGD